MGDCQRDGNNNYRDIIITCLFICEGLHNFGQNVSFRDPFTVDLTALNFSGINPFVTLSSNEIDAPVVPIIEAFRVI